MREPLTPRQQAEAIEQFGDDLMKLVVSFDRLCGRMSSDFTDLINAIPHQDGIETVAEAFRTLGGSLCDLADSAEEAEDWRRANPLEPGFRRLA